MNNFKLEDEWSIKVTEENSLIVGEYFGKASKCYSDWYDSGSKRSLWKSGWKYLKSRNSIGEPVEKSSHSSFSSKEPWGQLLTTEEFEKYVLNKEVVQSDEYNKILIKLLTK